MDGEAAAASAALRMAVVVEVETMVTGAVRVVDHQIMYTAAVEVAVIAVADEAVDQAAEVQVRHNIWEMEEGGIQEALHQVAVVLAAIEGDRYKAFCIIFVINFRLYCICIHFCSYAFSIT